MKCAAYVGPNRDRPHQRRLGSTSSAAGRSRSARGGC